MDLVARVLAAGDAAMASAANRGHAGTRVQQVEMLIAQVQAILAPEDANIEPPAETETGHE